MRLTVTALLICLTGPALAEPPRVLADTPPLHSLVALVAGDLFDPGLVLPPGTTPHDFALRPSGAMALAEAGVVFWVGPELTPWLAEPLANLAPEATTVAMLATGGWTVLPLRHDIGTDDHNHGDGSAIDPHAWLDPEVALVWLGHIADTLAAADPENAPAYRANARAAQDRIGALSDRIAADLAPLAGRRYLVPHDAYQYFEARFGLPASGAVTLSDAAAPGPARLASLRAQVLAEGITCLLTDPQTSPDLVALVGEGTGLRTAPADPDGTGLPPGPDLYAALLEQLAAALIACLDG